MFDSRVEQEIWVQLTEVEGLGAAETTSSCETGSLLDDELVHILQSGRLYTELVLADTLQTVIIDPYFEIEKFFRWEREYSIVASKNVVVVQIDRRCHLDLYYVLFLREESLANRLLLACASASHHGIVENDVFNTIALLSFAPKHSHDIIFHCGASISGVGANPTGGVVSIDILTGFYQRTNIFAQHFIDSVSLCVGKDRSWGPLTVRIFSKVNIRVGIIILVGEEAIVVNTVLFRIELDCFFPDVDAGATHIDRYNLTHFYF